MECLQPGTCPRQGCDDLQVGKPLKMTPTKMMTSDEFHSCRAADPVRQQWNGGTSVLTFGRPLFHENQSTLHMYIIYASLHNTLPKHNAYKCKQI